MKKNLNAERRRLRHFEKLMKRIPGFEKGRQKVPKSCRECEYYQPRFRFRTCTYVTCRYGLDREIFRKHPLKKEHFAKPKVVNPNVI